MSDGMQQAGPGADDVRLNLIAKWHACGHDELDDYSIPRLEDGLWLTIAERIDRLAQHGGVAKRRPRYDGTVDG